MAKDSKYFAAKSAEDTACALLSRANSWYNELYSNGYLDKLKMMWAAYHGAYFSNAANGHQITFSGEQGELVNIAVNHIRNLAQHMLVIITANRPALKARAINTDPKSLVQARLANGLLDFYMREKRLEDYLRKAVEYAVVLGTGYIKIEWNANIGDTYEILEGEDGKDVEIREGDVQFYNLSPFDVVLDSNREDSNHDWVLCRSFKNRFDIIAQFPEYEDKILALPSKNDINGLYIGSKLFDETDLIPIYEFYHKRTESMPDGRYLLFLSDNVALLDSPMPYKNLPVYKISPSEILGTPFGYSPLFDILPIQDAINSLYSTILTNQSANGVQNILVPRGADVSIESLAGGLNIVEANTQFGPIQPLNLTNTPPEIFNFLNKLEQVAQILTGISSVSRGQPEPNLKSGNALALIQSMTLQFISGLQQSYVKLMEDVGTGLINILKDYADAPRIAMITGVKNKSYMQEFTGQDIANVNRVVVDVGNPLASTTAGKVEMAEQLLQMGLIKSPEQYFSVMETGHLGVMTDNTQFETDLIRSENEIMLNGKKVTAIALDQHNLHIREHRTVLSDPELRKDPDVLQATLEHIQEHLTLLREVDADLLNIIQEQPLGPQGGSPAAQLTPGMPASATQMTNLEMAPTEYQPMETPGQPAPATPPAPFENMPTQAAQMAP